ncbi:Putative Mg2+ and Co2+ transporter CorB [Mycoplasmopsis maculosa]|uniref:Mg2+ and Co2+ transporter CorB n=1 Tax=Mycoplasmopsis maculosa TaxID=114885 RepID=A0A449B5E0_9BACT|nr:hemolysin family protein [Mycoplasmopsis maculosa]VEU75785.1 Putative Mg2+ and Co2+ transporter CorB [Mycoplasmopsis maculosa]
MNTQIIVEIILFIVLLMLLILSGIFSASETAYTSLNKGKIETMVEQKQFGAKIIKKQYEFFNQTLSTILICNNIVNIASSSLVSYLLSKWILTGENNHLVILISTAIMTPIIVLFGEILPKLIAKKHPEKTAKTFCYLLQALYYIFWPFTFPISKFGKKILITNTEKDVKNLIDVAQNEGVLEANESLMAQNALDLDSTKVNKHFIRIKDVYTIDSSASVLDALEIFKETNYSRLPVLKDNKLIGIVHLKDIFYLKKGKVINYFKPVPYTSVNQTLSSALEKMRLQKSQMAFVTKTTSNSEVIGIITMEDILEELVGEIYDEFDQEEWEDFFEISLELFHVSGSVKMKEIFKRLEIDLGIEESEAELTLKEFLSQKISHSLRKNSRFSQNDVNFRILWINDKTKEIKVEIELGKDIDRIETKELNIK